MLSVGAWSSNANARHYQIASGKDISFLHILLPTFLDIVRGSWKSGAILELGCGTGELTNELAKEFGRIIGIDPAFSAICIAQKNRIAETELFVCARAEHFLLPQENRVSLIASNMTLHVIENLALVLSVVSRNLKAGGKFIFSIPHPYFFPEYKRDVFASGYTYSQVKEYSIPFVISTDPDPLPSPVSYFHRPLEFYAYVLKDQGFSIESILEPMPSEALRTIHPDYVDKFKSPRFMFISAEKN